MFISQGFCNKLTTFGAAEKWHKFILSHPNTWCAKSRSWQGWFPLKAIGENHVPFCSSSSFWWLRCSLTWQYKSNLCLRLHMVVSLVYLCIKSPCASLLEGILSLDLGILLTSTEIHFFSKCFFPNIHRFQGIRTLAYLSWSCDLTHYIH